MENNGARKTFGGANSNGTTNGTVRRNFGLKLGKTPKDYVLPPLPDEDDDLLSHYASPKCIFEPLPRDLFPGPETFLEEERQNAARFPCFKYYDLTKYSVDDARRLSAMDLIPKEALLKKNDQTYMQRTKRAKRITTESTMVAGYYRNKNEGVEMVYGGGPHQAAADAQAAARQDFPPGPGHQTAPPPKKQGNRLDFLASLRRQITQPAKPAPYPAAAVMSSQQQGRGMVAGQNTGVVPAAIQKKQMPRRNAAAPVARSRVGRKERENSVLECDDEDDADRSVHSTVSSASTGGEEDEDEDDVVLRKPGPHEKTTAIVAPAWIESADDKDKALAFIANEELGASDDEQF
ncbi:hypothetical protein BV898_09441 [Hypsibius exemplaris]|uniref:Uncharacterized protein n=1 Tax=Hypsibius exemplaris TaxID=2072580 RepID=A0A1W0WMK5_HYPEX|nr:hypothetical protein BV898_09441 [Hypsibius exemplaris]